MPEGGVMGREEQQQLLIGGGMSVGMDMVDQADRGMGSGQSQPPPSLPYQDINRLTPHDRAKVTELATKMMNQASEQQKQQSRVLISQRMSPGQVAYLRARKKDPLEMFYESQAFNVLKMSAGRIQEAATAAAAAPPEPLALAGAPPQVKIPDHIINHVNKISFRPSAQMVEKSGANASKWIEEMKERYGRALMTMESSKQKIAQIDKVINDRIQAGNPFKEEELRQLQIRKDREIQFHQDAHKWVEGVRKQQQGLANGVESVRKLQQGQANATPTLRNSLPASQVARHVPTTVELSAVPSTIAKDHTKGEKAHRSGLLADLGRRHQTRRTISPEIRDGRISRRPTPNTLSMRDKLLFASSRRSET